MLRLFSDIFATFQKDPQSLYEDIDIPESVPLGSDGLDYSVYEVLEAENFDLWTPGVIQGGMDRRAKVVKRRGRTIKQTKAHDIDNEFIVSFIIVPIHSF